jgi:hypothetical protein
MLDLKPYREFGVGDIEDPDTSNTIVVGIQRVIRESDYELTSLMILAQNYYSGSYNAESIYQWTDEKIENHINTPGFRFKPNALQAHLHDGTCITVKAWCLDRTKKYEDSIEAIEKFTVYFNDKKMPCVYSTRIQNAMDDALEFYNHGK